jgi:hypothetical protein
VCSNNYTRVCDTRVVKILACVRPTRVMCVLLFDQCVLRSAPRVALVIARSFFVHVRPEVDICCEEWVLVCWSIEMHGHLPACAVD